MSQTWQGAEEPGHPPPGIAGWVRVILRGVPLALLVFGGLAIHGLVRLVEWPLFGTSRPVTPRVTRFVCRNALRILGLGFHIDGQVMTHPGALVANHASWLDVFALNAAARLYFVSKSEVSGWPGIGWLARATGTVFIDRDRTQARAQTDLFKARLAAGHRLLFFPEGTSTDGRRVLPFKPTLFAAFFDETEAPDLYVQGISVIYRAPDGADQRFYGWWGDMTFESHLIRVLAARRQGSVVIVFHPPQAVAAFGNRKALARTLEAEIRADVMARL